MRMLTQSDVQMLRSRCTAILDKVSALCDFFGSQPMENWQIQGAKHILKTLDSELDVMYNTLIPDEVLKEKVSL